MPLMADAIMNRPIQVPWWSLKPEVDRDWADLLTWKIRLALDEAPVIVVDNVADYVWDNPQEVSAEFDTGLIPPFPAFWMEYRRPEWIHVKDRDRHRTSDYDDDRYGVYVACTDMDKWRAGEDPGAVLILDIGSVDEHGQSIIDHIPPETKWFYQMALVLQQKGGNIVGPITYRMVSVDEYGDIIGNSFHGVPHSETVYKYDPAFADEHGGGEKYVLHKYAYSTRPFEAALFFMNTRGIEHKPNPPRRKENERYVKKHGRPLITYKTLVVETVVGNPSGGSGTSTVKSEHIVRGHKADYRKGKGLFGKYKVLIYRAAHLAGDKSAGTVIKDYAVKPSRKTA